MPVVNKEPRRFAVELSTAIARSGLSLNGLVDLLSERGLTTTAANLSYWKTGRSLPRRSASRPIVTELERILSMPTGSLVGALHSDLNQSSLHVAEAPPGKSTASVPERLEHRHSAQFNSVAAVINWEHEVNREVFEETTIISADFRTAIHRTVAIVRLPMTGAVPTYHVGFFWDRSKPLTAESIGLHDLEGAVLAGIDRIEEDCSEMARLEIPPSFAAPGSLHRIAYTHRYTIDEPFDESVVRLYLWPLRFCTVRTVFEGEVPSDIIWELTSVERESNSLRRTTSTRKVDAVDGTAQVVLEDLASAIGRFAWTPPASVR